MNCNLALRGGGRLAILSFLRPLPGRAARAISAHGTGSGAAQAPP